MKGGKRYEEIKSKIKKIKTTKWSERTLGEKIVSVILTLLKGAVIVAAVLAIAGLAFSVIMGFVIASCIASALAGGFDYVGRDETFVRFR